MVAVVVEMVVNRAGVYAYVPRIHERGAGRVGSLDCRENRVKVELGVVGNIKIRIGLRLLDWGACQRQKQG